MTTLIILAVAAVLLVGLLVLLAMGLAGSNRQSRRRDRGER